MASIIRRSLVHAVRRYSQISYQLKPKTFLPKLSNYNVKFYESTGILRTLSTQAEANVAEDQNSADATSKKRDFQAETRMLLDIGAKLLHSSNEVSFDSDYSLALRREFYTYNIRRYSTVVGKDPEAKVKSAESNGLMVVDYAENSKQFYRVNFEEMTKSEVISYFSKREGILEAKLAVVERQLNNFKLPTKLRNEIEFYEDLLAPTFVPVQKDLQGYKGDARNIRSRTLKWKYILSLDHPSVIELKAVLKEEEHEYFCEAMGVLHKEVSKYLIHALKFALNGMIPPFKVTKKPEFDKYIDVILRVKKEQLDDNEIEKEVGE